MPKPSANQNPAFDIRQVSTAEYAATGIGDYAFGASPQPQSAADEHRGLQYLEAMRRLVSYDTDAPMAKLGIHPMTINVRGTVLPMGGVGGVSTMPAGRRKGHVRALMTQAFAHMREDGQPVSALYPFRESFYERLGYAGWPRPRYTTLNPSDLLPLLRTEKRGTIEHMRIADGYDAWVEFLRTCQSGRHGFSLKDPVHMAGLRDDNNVWLVLVREGDEITGAMTYRITGYIGSLIARTFYTRTATARYQLLEWIARHADQVKEARVRLPADVYPELWFGDLEAPTTTNDEENWIAPMGRIIAIDGLNGIGADDGEVTVELTDEHCPWNAGSWTLRGAGGTLEITQGGTPTATLTVQGLSALVFGSHEPEALVWRGWGDPDVDTIARLRAIFPPAVPFLHEEF
jgi:predicted acetyltransferase